MFEFNLHKTLSDLNDLQQSENRLSLQLKPDIYLHCGKEHVQLS